MDPNQALAVLTNVTGEIPLKRADAIIVQQALNTVGEVIAELESFKAPKPKLVPPEAAE